MQNQIRTPDELPDDLHFYSNVNKLKQMIRHLERIPLPFATTIPGGITAIVVGVGLFRLAPYLGLMPKILIPLAVAMVMSNFNPDGISLHQQLYAYIRSFFRPKHRIINRPVRWGDNRPKEVPDTKTSIVRMDPEKVMQIWTQGHQNKRRESN